MIAAQLSNYVKNLLDLNIWGVGVLSFNFSFLTTADVERGTENTENV